MFTILYALHSSHFSIKKIDIKEGKKGDIGGRGTFYNPPVKAKVVIF